MDPRPPTLIRIDDVELSAEHFKRIVEKGAEISSFFDAPLGKFNPSALCITSAKVKGIADRAVQQGGITFAFNLDELSASLMSTRKTITDDDEYFRWVLSETSSFHEIQHFNDSYSTQVGISRFLNGIQYMASAASYMRSLAEEGHALTEPLSSIPANTNISEPNDWQEVVELIYSLRLNNAIFDGDLDVVALTPLTTERPPHILRLREPNWPNYVAAFPSNASSDGQPLIVARPIGFRALTEARAIGVQMEIIGKLDEATIFRFEAMARSKSEYTLANMMFLRAWNDTVGRKVRDDIDEFTVAFHRWTFHALNNGPEAGDALNPGLNAAEMLSQSLGSSGFETPEYSDAEIESAIELRDFGDDLVHKDVVLDEPHKVVLEYVWKEICRPSISAYIDNSDGKSGAVRLDDLLWPYVRALMADGSIEGGAGLLTEAPFWYHYNTKEYGLGVAAAEFIRPNLRWSWFYYLAFERNIAEAWASYELTCPCRDDSLGSLFRSIQLPTCRYPGCQAEDGVGKARIGDRVRGLRHCIWTDMLKYYGFIK